MRPVHTTNVCDLRKDPSRALELAKEAPVLVLTGAEPQALLVHLDASLTDPEAGIRPALAAHLYQAGTVSLGKAARISGLMVAEFIDHLGSLGFELVRRDKTTRGETDDLSRWLKS